MSTPKMKIEFTEDVEVLNHLKKIDFAAKAGEVRELSVASARRWLNRNKAVQVIQGKPDTSAATKPSPDEASEKTASKTMPTKPKTAPRTSKKKADDKSADTSE